MKDIGIVVADNIEEESLIFLVTTEMEKALPLSIPVVVEYGIGDNWYEAH